MIFEIDLFDNEQIEYINSKLSNELYVNGNISNSSSIKNNLIHKTDGQYSNLNKYCQFSMREKIYSVYLLKKMSQVYFLKYTKGMHYGYHIDEYPIAGVNAHYSMTCFLNSPSEYDGGELVLKVGSREIQYKLGPGKAVIYPTGIWHKVNEVKFGERNVFVCWMETIVKNSFMRNHLIEYGNYINSLKDDSIVEQLEQFRINLMREYGDL
jgi:PKHD-type hydroxylase